jgi:hypothetical protein
VDFNLADAEIVLARTPEVLRVWLAGLPAVWLEGTEGPDTFSPNEVLGHLIHGEAPDWIPRARRILEQGTAVPFDPFDRFAHRRLLQGRSTRELLDQFTSLRAANLATLRAWKLDATRLDLRGHHPELGDVTLRQLLATWVAHDLGHLAQIARVMAKQYTAAVGPWYAYLPVLHPRTPAR